jgi:ubiquinone/menaquinone biosynthesis C-methylase UbiE
VLASLLQGDALELGTCTAANAAAVLARFPETRLTATDVDPKRLDSARKRLVPFGERASVMQADATRLEFSDSSIDVVLSMIMLHHVAEWRSALSEVARVLRPGG